MLHVEKYNELNKTYHMPLKAFNFTREPRTHWKEWAGKVWLTFPIQVCTFQDGCKQGIDQQIFNRKSISGKITHPQSLFKLNQIL